MKEPSRKTKALDNKYYHQEALAIMIKEKQKTSRVPNVCEQQDINRITSPKTSPDSS